MGGRVLVVLVLVAGALALASTCAASDWLPHQKGTSWTYAWSDSVYSPTPTKEKVSVKSTKGGAFTLAWATDGLDNPPDAVSSSGTVSFQDTTSGVVNTNWTSSPPPTSFPVLCAQATSCGNSLASVWFNVIWGTRVPTLLEPLIAGASWTSSGGYQNDVASSSDYVGTEKVSVPAFAHPVVAAKIRTDLSQAGALGDPYGSGVRDVWWVYGVGPVKIRFRHGGGTHAPVTTASLVGTTLVAKRPPSDVDYFPLTVGLNGKFRWTNTKHLPQAEVQSFKIVQAVNNSARFTIASVSGPIHTNGAYFFTRRTDGVSNLAGSAKAATTAKLPPLGPSSLPASKRRHFYTVFDLMEFGFNPVLPAYSSDRSPWSSARRSRDFDVYGVTGSSRVLGIQRVNTPAGTFRALAVRTTLKQPGYPWGSGVRTSWFAPGKGLVKLVFAHDDGSVSNVVRL